MQTFSGQNVSRTLQVMDVRSENRRHPHRKVCFLRPRWWGETRKGQECPQEMRTKWFMFMLFFFPDSGWKSQTLGHPRRSQSQIEPCLCMLGIYDFGSWCCRLSVMLMSSIAPQVCCVVLLLRLLLVLQAPKVLRPGVPATGV